MCGQISWACQKKRIEIVLARVIRSLCWDRALYAADCGLVGTFGRVRKKKRPVQSLPRGLKKTQGRFQPYIYINDYDNIV